MALPSARLAGPVGKERFGQVKNPDPGVTVNGTPGEQVALTPEGAARAMSLLVEPQVLRL